MKDRTKEDFLANEKIILHLCADIGSDSAPYREAGYDVRLIGSDIGVENFHAPPNVYGIIANPPCTMFSIARTRAKTPRNIREGLFCVKHCLRIIWEAQCYMTENVNVPHRLKFWYIENPATGYLKNYLGKPTYRYCQSKFGSSYTKDTALWGNFNEPKPTTPEAKLPKGSSITDVINKTNCRDDKERMHRRSMCCEGFAKVFFEVNK